MSLKPGYIVLFSNRTLAQAGIRGWLADLITLHTQRIFCCGPLGLYTGFHTYCHVGITVLWRGKLCLLEWKPGGICLQDAYKRLDLHKGKITVAPLNDDYAAIFDTASVAEWIDKHFHYVYRWGGLIFCLFHRFLGNIAPGAFFCSEAVVTLLKDLGIVPSQLPVVRRGEIVEGILLPHAYAPAEIPDLPQTARAKMFTWEITNE